MQREVDFVILGILTHALPLRDALVNHGCTVALLTGGEPSEYAGQVIRRCKKAILTIGIPEALAEPTVVQALAEAKSSGTMSILIPPASLVAGGGIARLDEFVDFSARGRVEGTGRQFAHEEILIPEGGFIRGTSQGEEEILLRMGSAVLPIEKPQRSIYLDAFVVDKYSVTNEQFCVFVDSAGYEPEGVRGWGTWKEYSCPGKETHPVVCLSFQDMLAYCDWVGRRLPTEAEWEKAARGTDGRLFPWGNEPDSDKCNVASVGGVDSGARTTTPVDRFPEGASPYGCCDMVGNVWEMVQDWLDLPASQEGSYYSVAPYRNPKGPVFGLAHVMRGGAFSTHIANCRCAFRIGPDASTRFDRVGFRTARDA